MHAVSSSIEDDRDSRQRLHLLYHELRPSKSEYSYVVSTSVFEEQMDVFIRARQTSGAKLFPEITFDDGHISNHHYALPILQARGIHARFFITAGWIGQKPGYMDWPEVRALHEAGHLLGAHGWSHALLTHCTNKDLKRELLDARLSMEEKLGIQVTTMSLPGGRFNRRVIAACQEAGYTKVYSSIPQAESLTAGYMIGRLNIRGDMKLPWISALFQPGSNALASLERQYRMKSAAKSVLGDRMYAKVWGLLNREETDTSPGGISPE